MNSSAGSSSISRGIEASSGGGSTASTPDVSVPSQHCSEPLAARPVPPDSLGIPRMAPPLASATASNTMPSSMPVGDLLELQWMDHRNIFSQNIAKLRNEHMYTDATLACDGQFYPVHKFVLATCSEFFSAMFEWTPCVNPVLVLNNILTRDLEAILDFMYTGEASVKECNFSHVMKAAQSLRVRGLAMLEESRPVMHKPPTVPGVGGTGIANSSDPHFSKPSHHRQHPTLGDSKQNVSLNASFVEPSSKRLKSEPVEESKPPGLTSDSRSRLLKPMNKPPISLPSISSLTSPLHDTSLPKSQQMSIMHVYEASGSRATQAAHPSTAPLQSHHIPRSHAQLPRPSSSPHPHLAGASSPHHAPPSTSRHLQQLLSSSKSSPAQQQVYRHPSAATHSQQQQQLMQQRRKDALLQHQQQLETERRHLQQLMQQNKLTGLPHSSHPQQQQQGPQHHQVSPQHHHQVSSPQHHHQASSPQRLPSSQPHPHHQLQLPQHQQPQTQHHLVQQQQHVQHPRSMQPHYSQSFKQQQQQQQQQRPQTVHGEIVDRQNPQLQASHVHHQQSQPAVSTTQQQQQLENELPNKGNENTRVSELLLDHQSDLTSLGMKNSNGSTPTGNNNNLATGNHNFVSDQPSPGYNCRDESSLQVSLPPPPPPAAATLGTSGGKTSGSTTSVAAAVLDAAPLTPMEQQIISELGAATDGGIGATSAPDADKAADGDSPEDMLDVLVCSNPPENVLVCSNSPDVLVCSNSPDVLVCSNSPENVLVCSNSPDVLVCSNFPDDVLVCSNPPENVLVNEDSLYGFNDDAGGSEEAVRAAPALSLGDGAAAVTPDAAKQRDRRSTRPRFQNRTVMLAKKRKRKSSSGASSDAAPSENAVQVQPAELTSEGGMELARGDDEDALTVDPAYSLSGDSAGCDDDGAGSSNTRMMPRLKCPHCPKICLKSETLAKHLQTHQDKEYSCSTCGFASTDFLELRDHRRSHMSKHCTRCKFSTNRADALKKHLAMHVGGTRTGDGINSCNMCDFTPKNPTALKHHMKNHHDIDLSRDAS
ncbi:BTB/POZ domain [Trinorchestia longiramus]|nr:BTB/POZ domain [Trinorchestia longiramus]